MMRRRPRSGLCQVYQPGLVIFTLISARRIGRLPSSVLILWLPFVPSSCSSDHLTPWVSATTAATNSRRSMTLIHSCKSLFVVTVEHRLLRQYWPGVIRVYQVHHVVTFTRRPARQRPCDAGEEPAAAPGNWC